MIYSLADTLRNHASFIGKGYENLGKRTQASWWPKKQMLSFSEKGWNIVQLNWIELFFRKLGFYKTTHLKNIAERWSYEKETEGFKDPVLKKKLYDLWKKTYPKSEFPTYLVKLGNIKPSKAKLKIFAERHDDDDFRKAVGRKITKAYQPNDVILVEGLECDQKIIAQVFPPTKYIKGKIVVKGLEPLGEMEIVKEIFRSKFGSKLESWNKAMVEFGGVLLDEIGGGSPKDFSTHNLKSIGEKLKNFTLAYTEAYTDMLQDGSSNKTEKKRKIDEIDTLHTTFQNLKNEEDLLNFSKQVVNSFDKANIDFNKYIYNEDCSPERTEKLIKGFPRRNENFCKVISKYLEKKTSVVFATMGAHHSLHLPEDSKDEKEAIDEIQKIYVNTSFVLYVERKGFEEWQFNLTNPNLIFKK